MAWPTVIIKIENLMNGPIAGVENHFLYVIYGAVEGETRNLIMVDSTTDLAGKLAGAGAEGLAIVEAAQLNGKSNWTAGVMILDEADNWQDAIKLANETSSFEFLCLGLMQTEPSLKARLHCVPHSKAHWGVKWEHCASYLSSTTMQIPDNRGKNG
ncbi:DUF2586 family protein [Vibrio parahaemolyticus]|nr:DUF2586 family protein [Vibrio parahaemolyticus]MDN4711611.1 DUF2586 family protein [Vibrio parahaemolyticus]